MSSLPVRSALSRRWRATASTVGALLLSGVALAGCGSLDSPVQPTPSANTDLTAVVVAGPDGDKPEVTIPKPFAVQRTTSRVLRQGTGAKVQSGQRVTISYVGFNGTDGREFDSSYGKQATSFVLDPKNNLKGLVSGLTGVAVGSRILLAIPPDDGYGLTGRPAASIGPTDTILIVVDVKAAKTVLVRATGKVVARKAGLPTVTLGPKGAPKIALPSTAPPAALVVQPLIVGAGEKVTRGQQITVEYTGVIWPGGTQFDSSWPLPAPPSFTIGQGRVIAGWDDGLVGQTVGSQMLLVIPPDKGYGAEGKPGAGIKGTDTLVFVVDILDAV